MNETVLQLLRGRGAGLAPGAPQGHVAFTPLLPADDGGDDVPATPMFANCLGCTVGIRYVNAAGAESRRRITIRSIHRRTAVAADLLIRAYCHECAAPRSFVLSRMREVVDLETGEIFEDPRIYFRLIALPGAAEEDDTARALDRVRPELQVLVTLARADGRFHPAEERAVMAFIERSCADLAPDWQAVRRYVRSLFPDKGNYLDAVARLSMGVKDGAEGLARFERLIDALVEVAEADGEVKNAERAFFERLRILHARIHGLPLSATSS